MSIDPNKPWTDARGGAAIPIQVVTKTSETEMVGLQEDGAFKIRLKASPAGSKEANDELIAFLAKKLGVGKDKIEIVAGAEKRDKIISIEGVTALEVEAKLGVD